MAFHATPAPQCGTAPMRQSIALQAIPTLASPIADRSLAERFASMVTGESVNFNLIRDGVEHRRIFGSVAVALRQVVQNINRETGEIYMDWDASMSISLNLESLVSSLGELNPEEQAAICTAKLNGNQTFPMLVARHASGATGALLDIISGMDTNTRAAIFTAQNSDSQTFPMCVAEGTLGYAPEVTEKFFNAVNGLGARIQANVFTAQDNSNQTLAMLIARHARGAT
ncbi:MAG: hypothetical protein LBJ94_02175, partial [Puniceicoccales bacterium]|nr:hypothetical protein [Puniceicoccales bacterium]